jgi:hypothetical protein
MIQPTVAEMIKLDADERLEMLKAAKAGIWHEGWKPYCLMCETMQRMAQRPYGFQCHYCRNMIGWNLNRLRESPLNIIS